MGEGGEAMLRAQGWVPGSLEPFLLTRQEPESPHSCPAVQSHPGPSWTGIHGPEGGLGAEGSGVGLRAGSPHKDQEPEDRAGALSYGP